MKFLTLNVNFSNHSTDPLGVRSSRTRASKSVISLKVLFYRW